MQTAPVALAPQFLQGAPVAPEGKTRAEIADAAKEFEASFLSMMFSQMFQGVGEGEFSGGQGATMFRSFLMDAMADQMTRSGGIGLSDSVQREMLKLQGLE